MAQPELALLPADETATLLHVSVKTLERWRIEGTGPQFCRVGRKPMYRAIDLMAWIQSRLVASTSERLSA
jgi:hypothetical protein